MNIIDAIKSGKRFRRGNIAAGIWCHLNAGDRIEDAYGNRGVYMNGTDLLAEDWEIEEEKVELTRSQALELYESGRNSIHLYGTSYSPSGSDWISIRNDVDYRDRKLTELGFGGEEK